MHCTVKMTEDLYWVGASDRRLALFESVYPIPRGVSYNAYVLLDEKTVLLDTVDQSVAGQFFENLAYVLGDRPLDYIVVHHMEPDHAKTLEETVRRYPEAKIICNAKIRDMIRNYFTFDIDARAILMAEGDTYCFGKHTFAYVMAPMVHWPEVMVSFDTTTGTLFSADAFGTFGALSGNLYADEYDFEHDWLPDARRYYTNIVGKYGTQVQALLKKAATLDIRMICPLHGPVWRKNIGWFVDKYSKWSSYTPEQEGSVLIAYSSVYGHTENAAQVLATMLAGRGVRNIAMYDVSVTHPSYVVAEAFRCSHLVFASTTYNAGIFCNMETALLDIAAHNLQNRTIALIENGSWAPTAGKLMRGILSKLKNVDILNETLTIKSSLKDDQLTALAEIADALVASMPKPRPIVNEGKQNPAALFKFQYGLFALSAREGDKDNACVINTAIQMANKPEQVREKIVMGKMNKFYSENCLLQQEFVRGDVFTGTVEQYIADAAKKLGGKITFVDAIRFEKGEGIEKKQENFAEEIAKMVKG